MSALADIARGRSLPFDCAPIQFTPHAVEQVNARYFRMLDLDAAERKLNRLAAEHGRISTDTPPWLFKRRGRAACWLVIDTPEVQAAFPLYGDSNDDAIPAGTCLTPRQTPTGASVRWTGGADLFKTSGIALLGPEDAGARDRGVSAPRPHPPTKGP